jgi:hypothetical protein
MASHNRSCIKGDQQKRSGSCCTHCLLLAPPCLQFVSEFFTYEPLEDPSQPPSHIVSP